MVDIDTLRAIIFPVIRFVGVGPGADVDDGVGIARIDERTVVVARPIALLDAMVETDAVEAVEGFGILSMASICPIVSVLITGLWVQRGSSKSKSEA